MHDRARRETAIGEVAVVVVDLTLDAVMQSGSLRISGVTSSHMLQVKVLLKVSMRGDCLRVYA